MNLRIFSLSVLVVLLTLTSSAQFPCFDAYVLTIKDQLSKQNYQIAKNKFLDMRDNCSSSELRTVDQKRKDLLSGMIEQITHGTAQEQLQRNIKNVLYPQWDSASGKYGYVDKTGKKVVGFIYDDAGQFELGYAWVQKGDNEGYIDVTGKEVRPLKYLKIEYADDEVIKDKDGNSVFSSELKNKKVEVEGVHPEGEISIVMNRVILTVDGMEGLYDCEAKKFIITPGKYKIRGVGHAETIPRNVSLAKAPVNLDVLYDPSNFLLLLTREKPGDEDELSYSLVNFDNKVLVPFGKYDDISGWGPFDGFFEVERNGLHGLIDCNGKEVLSPVFDGLKTPQGGYIAVKNNKGLWGLLDYTGRKVMDYNYKDINNAKGYFINDLCAVQNEAGLWGYIDRSGQQVIPFKYQSSTPFLGNYALVEIEDLEWIMIDNKGKTRKTEGTFHAGEYQSGFIDKRNRIVAAFHSPSAGGTVLESVNEEGAIETIGINFLPYYINFEGYKKTDYLELVRFDIENRKTIRLFVTPDGSVEKRVSETGGAK